MRFDFLSTADTLQAPSFKLQQIQGVRKLTTEKDREETRTFRRLSQTVLFVMQCGRWPHTHKLTVGPYTHNTRGFMKGKWPGHLDPRHQQKELVKK